MPLPVFAASGVDVTQIGSGGASATLDNPDLASITISCPEFGTVYPHFLAYEFDEHYLTPCAKFWFDLDLDEMSALDRRALVPGTQVVIQVAGLTQCTGIIDETPIRTGKSGSVIHVEGRDWISPAVDSQVDPTTQFNPTQTIAQFVTAVFSPFGFTAILDDNIANLSLQTGQKYGLKANAKTGKTSKSTLAHQVKPYPNEHAFEFAARVCQREGLWIRPGATPGQVIVTVPNYDQDPSYVLLHSTSDPSSNNIENGTVIPSRKDQPSVIFAYGTGGGGVFANTAVRCAILNPFVTVGTGSIDDNDTALLAQFVKPGQRSIPVVILGKPPAISGPTSTASPSISGVPILFDDYARPLFIEDPDSHTQSEIEAFARRKMSLLMRHRLGVHYEIMGHRIGGVPIALDTIASVQDDRSGLRGSFWCLSRKFSKSGSGGGSKTESEWIIPSSLQF